MAKYRLLTGSHTINRVTYRSGVEGQDILELSEDQAKGFDKSRLRRVGEKEDTNDNDDTLVSTLTDEEIQSLLSKSIPDIEKGLDKVSDNDTLDRIESAEQEGQQRVGLFKLISRRREEL